MLLLDYKSPLCDLRLTEVGGGKLLFPTCEIPVVKSFHSASVNLQVGKGGLAPLDSPQSQCQRSYRNRPSLFFFSIRYRS
jgi:hypothetical protein